MNPISVRLPQAMRESVVQQSVNLKSNNASKSDTESLRAKLKAGKELTPSELEYLKVHDPDLYSKAMTVTQEREAYKSSLRQCRTRNEAVKLHGQALTRVLHGIKNGDPDEAIMRANAIQDTHRQFLQSDEYASLDWDE